MIYKNKLNKVDYNNLDNMSKLTKLNGIDDESVLNDIFNSEIIVFEDIQGSKIWVSYSGSEFLIRPKSISNDNINLIDLAMQNYYNPATNYFNSLDSRVRGLLNKNWWFGFEYFPDNQPANIQYSRTPKNGLVLSAIYKSGKYSYTVDELDEYARLFDVDMIPIIYQGKLPQPAIEAIKYFINTSEKDLEYVFGESSFAYFFYKLLNPAVTHSFLMNDTEYQTNIEKLVIKIQDKNVSFELLNPLYRRISDTNSTEFTDIYSLILVNFLTFSQSINLNDIKIKGNRKDESYIYLICKLFNMYVAEVQDDLMTFDFVIPEFFNKEKFKINKELISNKMTREFLENSKLEYIFKVILGSFNRKRKKPVGIFTDGTVSIFNQFVDTISSTIDKHLNKLQEIELKKSQLLDFSDYFEISYDKDADDQVYPDVWDEMQRPSDSKKKGGVPDKKISDEGGLPMDTGKKPSNGMPNLPNLPGLQ